MVLRMESVTVGWGVEVTAAAEMQHERGRFADCSRS